MFKLIKITVISALLAALTACQAMPYKPYARRVKVTPQKGGEVALNLQHREEDRQKAEGIMKSTCGQRPYSVFEEGEVVVGSVTNSNANHKAGRKGEKVGSLWGIPITSGSKDPSTSSSSTTTQKKEWRIKYKCKNIASRSRKKNKSTL